MLFLLFAFSIYTKDIFEFLGFKQVVNENKLDYKEYIVNLDDVLGIFGLYKMNFSTNNIEEIISG